jgi:hypothetical protein
MEAFFTALLDDISSFLSRNILISIDLNDDQIKAYTKELKGLIVNELEQK